MGKLLNKDGKKINKNKRKWKNIFVLKSIPHTMYSDEPTWSIDFPDVEFTKEEISTLERCSILLSNTLINAMTRHEINKQRDDISNVDVNKLKK
ncbi:MAG: hypothetical protein ACQEQF_00565 [Bacillota bacterium]